MSLNYPSTVELFEEDGEVHFGLEIPDLPGVWADGKTIEEAYASLVESKKAWLGVRLKKGMDIPEPASEEDYSGKFILRLTPKLHMELTKNAKQANTSLNQYVRSVLEKQINNSALMAEIRRLNKIVKQQSQNIEVCVKALQSIQHRITSLEDSFSFMSDRAWIGPIQATAHYTRRPEGYFYKTGEGTLVAGEWVTLASSGDVTQLILSEK